MNSARILAYVFVVVAAVNSARVVAQQPAGTSSDLPPVTDPLARELRRCQALHEQAANDEKCQAASKEANRRFFTPPADYHPSHIDLFPGVPDPKTPAPKQDSTGK
jgi:conjugative transfer region protein TrbK